MNLLSKLIQNLKQKAWVLSSLLLIVIHLPAALGICDDERLRRNRAWDLVKKWENHSKQSSSLGGIVGGLVLGLTSQNPALVGAAVATGGLVFGGTTGAVAARLEQLYYEREKALADCEQHYLTSQKRNVDRLQEAGIETIAKWGGPVIAGAFYRVSREAEERMEFQKRMDELLIRHIDDVSFNWEDSHFQLQLIQNLEEQAAEPVQPLHQEGEGEGKV